MTALAIDAAAALSPGARARQEDALASAFHQGGDLGFAILSDGMGGHAAGDVASRMIVAEIFAELTLATAVPGFSPAQVPMLLRRAVEVANDCLAAHVAEVPSSRGMGGTVIVAVVAEGRLYWVSVGDSPLYLWRGGALRRLNADHSMAPQIDLMVARGMMDAETGRNHPQRSCLTSALTGDPLAEVDCPETPLALEPGDLVLVASDGIMTLPEPRIAKMLKAARRRGSGEIVERLLSAVAAAEAPEQDNTGLVVLKARALPSPQAARSGAPRAGLWPALAQAFQPARPRGARSG